MKQIGQTITTVEIAEMTETTHFDVLKKLEGAKDRKGIIKVLTDNQMSVSDYFTESTYKDASGKENKCYLVTKLGCDFLANKFTGEKGILFTAKYVKRFHEMEDTILRGFDGLSTEMQALIMHDKKIQSVIEHIEKSDNRIEHLESNMVIDYGQQQVLKEKVNSRVTYWLGGKNSNAYNDISKVVFSECNKDIQRYFNANSRNNIPRIKFDDAIKYVENWEPCHNTKLVITDCNNQLNI